jgi:DNA-directed RNA polymerase subunit E'/Rpb7
MENKIIEKEKSNKKIKSSINEKIKTSINEKKDLQYKNNKIIMEDVFSKALLSRNVNISFKNIGKNFREIIENNLKEQLEGKCIVEGYIQKDTIKIITHSSGLVKSNVINFEVVFECMICFPVEGMIISCIVKNVTKAGIRAESSTNEPSPFILFISRDHHNNNKYFNTLKEGDTFLSRVIGQRYELNDSHIYIIGELVKPFNNKKNNN